MEVRSGVRRTAYERPSRSAERAVLEVDGAVAKTAFVQQLELDVNVVGESAFAGPHHDGNEEEAVLVDQPSLDRLRRKTGTPDGEVMAARRLELPDPFGIELVLDSRPGARHRSQRL